ncbi:ABC transporter permease [Pseudogemmobacter humi]|uniref:Macrolide export ATP-binding/permease protein MacB n=1 Tax=Pseudogemmobacter humi TaxID=2483812 RepID=A0A3P5XD71_9RHOB|nr:ABC transporter permease [Pseudogemmobacter humi]VDC32658.1 Macrolide export ATP-binding/permease protein MacB [Pseudogemmobacter humi]
MILEAVRLALRSILRNKLRSFLTILGVVIGVGAVIAMVTVGQGSSQQVSQSVSGLGSDMLVLRPGQRGFGPQTSGGNRRFNLRDADALSELREARLVAPVTSSSVTAVYGNTNASTQVTGSNEAFLEVAGWTLADGRNMTAAEARGGAAYCILGDTVRQKLFGGGDAIGEQIRVKQISCQVIGLLQAKGASSFGNDQDDLIIMPIRLVQRRLNGDGDVNSIQIALASGVTTTEGIAAVQDLMRDRRRIGLGQEDNFNVSDMREVADMLNSVNSVLSGMLSSVAAVSLLVGGIGIMNIMLVSVTERTREIGIRLAIGATSGQVLTQFLVEAVVLSLLGGVVGIGVGLALAWGAGIFMAIPFAPDPLVVLMAFGFSAVVGVVFGYFPARRAARLDPIEALRHQ